MKKLMESLALTLATARVGSMDQDAKSGGRQQYGDECATDAVQSDDCERFEVGLVRIRVPRDEPRLHDLTDSLKNDIVLEMAVREVTTTLYIFIGELDKRAAVQYRSELYETISDIASYLDKEDLDVNIVSSVDSEAPTWDELVMRLDLEAVYGSDQVLKSGGSKHLARGDLLPVIFRSPNTRYEQLRIGEAEYAEHGTRIHDKHDVAIVHGIWDHLHNGHKKLLAYAATMCKKKLVVGVVNSPNLLAAQPVAELLEPFEVRKRNMLSFLQATTFGLEIEIVEAEDDIGPAATYAGGTFAFVISSTDIENARKAYTLRQQTATAMWVFILRRTNRSVCSSRRIRAAILAASKVE